MKWLYIHPLAITVSVSQETFVLPVGASDGEKNSIEHRPHLGSLVKGYTESIYWTNGPGHTRPR